ncbi:MAG: response regulator [Candidatus Korobacteraceae bacterium]
MNKPKILIADDHTMVVEAFRKLLEPQYEVVGSVGDGRALLDSAPQLQPDVIIIDIGMPLLNGLAAGQQLKKLMRRVKLVYVTMNEDPELARDALQHGASVYLLKTSAASELLKGIHEALKGGQYVTPSIRQAMEDAFVRLPNPKSTGRRLTPRQIEVLQLLAEGHSMKQAAAILGLTSRTIAFHKYRMMEVLGLTTSAELIQYAVKHHLTVA